MRYLVSLLLIVICFTANSQTTYPTGLPSPKADSGFYQIGYIRPMVLGHTVIGDTAIRPKYNGATRLWFNAGVDTAFWAWKDTKWYKVSSSSSGGGGGNAVDTIYSRNGASVDSFFYQIGGTEYFWYANPAPDGFIIKPTVTYTGYERTYYVNNWLARIGGQLVSDGDTTITLAAPSPDSSRSDLFVATSSGTSTTVTGTESANPVQPGYTLGTQLPIAYVLLTPAAESGITDSIIVYNEQNVGEFLNVTGTGVTVNPANTLNPYVGTKAISVGAINNNDIIGIGRTVSVNVSTSQALAFAIKLNQIMPNNNGMLVSIWSNGVQVGNEIGIPFNRTQLTYQLFSIALSAFQLTNTVIDSVRFRYSGGGAGMASGMYIDYVYFERGIPGGGGGDNFVQDVFERNDSLYQVKSGIEYFVGLLGGGGITSLNTDVVATGPGAAVATIQPNAVTYAKMQQMVGLSVLGRANNTTGNMDAITPSAKSILITNMATTAWGNPDSSYFASGFHTNGYYEALFQAKLNGTGYVKASGTAISYQATPIPIADGGTNNGSLSVTAGTIYYGDGTKIVGLAPGTAAQHLTGGATPAWRDTAAGGLTGSGANTRVAYWSGTSSLTSAAAFTYSSSILTLSPTVGGSNTDILRLSPNGTGTMVYSYNGGSALGTWKTGYGNLFFDNTTTSGGGGTTTFGNATAVKFLGTSTAGARLQTTTKTLPTTVNNYVELCNGTISNGTATIQITASTSTATFALSKVYFVNCIYNATAGSWVTLLPISRDNQYTNQDFDIDININNNLLGLRVRRSAGTTAGNVDVTIMTSGTSDFTVASGTGSTSAPTSFYGSTVLTQFAGNAGANVQSPSAQIHIGAGTATAGTAPFKVNAGTKLGTPESGTIEYVSGSFVLQNDGLTLGTSAMPASAIMDVQSTTKGSLGLPRMTTAQFGAISSKATGLLAYDTDNNAVTAYDGTRVVTIPNGLKGSASLDFGSIASLGNAELTITVTGAADGDVVNLGVPNASFTAGLVFTARVSATNTVSVQCYNSTGGAIDPTGATFKVFVVKN